MVPFSLVRSLIEQENSIDFASNIVSLKSRTRLSSCSAPANRLRCWVLIWTKRPSHKVVVQSGSRRASGTMRSALHSLSFSLSREIGLYLFVDTREHRVHSERSSLANDPRNGVTRRAVNTARIHFRAAFTIDLSAWKWFLGETLETSFPWESAQLDYRMTRLQNLFPTLAFLIFHLNAIAST